MEVRKPGPRLWIIYLVLLMSEGADIPGNVMVNNRGELQLVYMNITRLEARALSR